MNNLDYSLYASLNEELKQYAKELNEHHQRLRLFNEFDIESHIVISEFPDIHLT